MHRSTTYSPDRWHGPTAELQGVRQLQLLRVSHVEGIHFVVATEGRSNAHLPLPPRAQSGPKDSRSSGPTGGCSDGSPKQLPSMSSHPKGSRFLAHIEGCPGDLHLPLKCMWNRPKGSHFPLPTEARLSARLRQQNCTSSIPRAMFRPCPLKNLQVTTLSSPTAYGCVSRTPVCS